MTLRRKAILFNVQFWLAYFLYEWLSNAAVYCDYERYLFNAAVIVPMTLAAAMVTVHLLIKKLFLKGKKRLFWLLLFLSMVLFVLARRSYNYYYTYPVYYPEGQNASFLFLPKLIIEAVSMYLIVGLYTMFHFIKAWYEQQRISQALQHDKTQTELQLLKSQVHPHFIFNTLNNIYSFSLQKNPKTPDLIYRLSYFLSYNLYDSKLKTIPISKELEYINHYIELEKVRYGNRLDVSVNIYDSLEGFDVSPLLLLPLVENCFKHGVNNEIEKSWIRIDLSTQKDWLIVKIENSYTGEKEKNGDTRNGIGLENVRRRLEILYPGKHELTSMHENQSYLTIMKIKN